MVILLLQSGTYYYITSWKEGKGIDQGEGIPEEDTEQRGHRCQQAIQKAED